MKFSTRSIGVVAVVSAVLIALPLDAWSAPVSATGNGYYNGNVRIDVSESDGKYTLIDPTRPGIQCAGSNGIPPSVPAGSVIGNGSPTDQATACVDVLYGAQRMWDMLRTWLGRNGIDGHGRGYGARVGATGSGTYIGFPRTPDGQRYQTSMDTVAYEYGLRVFQTTPGGMGSGNETGGLAVGAGDIFGALTEAYANNPSDPPDYLVREKVRLVPSGPIRIMYNPGQVGDPNCYSSQIPNTEVHAAAGPLDHWFYLLAEGSSPSNGNPPSPLCTDGPSSVTGIGIQKAGRIFMQSLLMKTSTWKYSDARAASVSAAIQLYGNASSECRTVKTAWDAVTVLPKAGEPTCDAPTAGCTISVSPSSGTAQPGGTVTTTIATQGSGQLLQLSVGGMPPGVTASISPPILTCGQTAQLVLSVGSATSQGMYSLIVTGTDPGGSSSSGAYTLIVAESRSR